MKCDPKDLLLYAVTDRHWLNGRTLVDVVKESLDGGVTMIQLREKSLDEGKFLEEAKELQALCRERHVPFIVNDNVDIAKAMEMPVEEVVFALEAIQDPVSLFEPVYHDGNDAMFVMDQVSDEKNKQENWLETIALSQALQRLAEREQNIIYLRYFKGRTQMEVAEEIGISQAQVSRLEKCALHRLKTQM